VEECINTAELRLASLRDDQVQAEEAVSEAEGLVTEEESKLSEAQALLVTYQNEVVEMQEAVKVAQTDASKVLAELAALEKFSAECEAAQCGLPTETVDYWDDDKDAIELLPDGAKWTPKCKDGFMVEYCCGSTEMTCGKKKKGELDPPSFHCAPVVTGTLKVRVLDGLGLTFKDSWGFARHFQWNPIPADPFVEVQACNMNKRTSVERGELNPSWDETLEFRIDENNQCEDFLIKVRDDRSDDVGTCSDYFGGLETLIMKEGNAGEKFLKASNAYNKQERKLEIEGGGSVNIEFEWVPDKMGITQYM